MANELFATALDLSPAPGSSASLAPTSAAVSTTPSWLSNLSTSSIKSDMAAADVNGVVTAQGLTKLLTDLDATLSSSTLTSAEFNDLQTIAANLNNGLSTSNYLTFVFKALADGNAANAYWTGGGTNTVALGNLAAGATRTQLDELIGKWFLGTDLPNSHVDMSYSTNPPAAPFNVSYSTVTNAVFGASGPSMDDINQLSLGDCYFEASCAEVADMNGSCIESMFSDNGNGTYGVRFYYDGAPKYVTVNLSLADGGTEFNHATDIWASLAEKAWAEFQAIDPETSYNYGNSWTSIGNGGWDANALEALTGASVITEFYANGTTWNCYTYNSSLAWTGSKPGVSTQSVLQTIEAALASHDDVVLTSNTNAYDSSGKDTLIADHVMSVYGYDSGTGMLEIRNPWGTASWQYWDTTFEVPLATLLADGDSIDLDNNGPGFTPIVTRRPNDLTHSSTASGYNNFIDLSNFEASYTDLIKAFGADQQAMQNWYNAQEPKERRVETFDGLDYVASYGDLINAFGSAASMNAVQDAGAMHYIGYGLNEGRSTTFNGLDYIASYGDLINAFGANNDAGAYHYIEYGTREGRTTTFDGLDYIASYTDLIQAFGANEQAGAVHYIGYGHNEGRTTAFDGLAYIADYTDLMRAFGANNDAGAVHYIGYGHNEGRTTTFNVAGYESQHPDLIGRYATNDQFLTAYINTYDTTGHLLT